MKKQSNLCPRCGIPYSEHTCYWQPCEGCPNGHNSFWKTIVESKEWKEWEKVAYENGFDWSESTECGWLSPQHFQAFLDWTTEERFKKELKVSDDRWKACELELNKLNDEKTI